MGIGNVMSWFGVLHIKWSDSASRTSHDAGTDHKRASEGFRSTRAAMTGFRLLFDLRWAAAHFCELVLCRLSVPPFSVDASSIDMHRQTCDEQTPLGTLKVVS